VSKPGSMLHLLTALETKFFVASVAHREARRPDAESTPERPTCASFLRQLSRVFAFSSLDCLGQRLPVNLTLNATPL
jgi:hypothetical protein